MNLHFAFTGHDISEHQQNDFQGNESGLERASEFTTEKLCFYSVRASDMNFLKTLINDDEIHEYSSEPIHSLGIEMWINEISSEVKFADAEFWIVSDMSKGILIGQMGVLRLIFEDGPRHCIVFMFAPDQWNQSWAAEALCGCAQYCFEKLKLTELCVALKPDDHRFRRLIQRADLKDRGQVIFQGSGMQLFGFERVAAVL